MPLDKFMGPFENFLGIPILRGMHGLGITKPPEPLVFLGDNHLSLPRFHQIVEDDFKYLRPRPAARFRLRVRGVAVNKGEALGSAKAGEDTEILVPQTGFFFHLPQKRVHRALPLLELAFREIPIVPAVVEEEKLYRALMVAPEYHRPGGDYLFHCIASKNVFSGFVFRISTFPAQPRRAWAMPNFRN